MNSDVKTQNYPLADMLNVCHIIGLHCTVHG